MSHNSQPFSIVIVNSNVPTWWTALADAIWTPIAGGAGYGAAWQNGSRIFDVLPSNSGSYGASVSDITDQYSGGCANQSLLEYYMPCSGGHQSYGGNEIYALALNQAVPGFSRIWGPSAVANLDFSDQSTNPPWLGYTDNTPRSTHGWFQNYCTKFNKIVVGQSAYYAPTGWHASNMWGIDRGSGGNISGSWIYLGRMWVQTAQGGSDGTLGGSTWFFQSAPGAYDSVTDILWRVPEADVIGTPSFRGFNVQNAYAAGEASHSGANYVSGLSKVGPSIGGGNYTRCPAWITTDTNPRCWVSGINSLGSIATFDVQTPGTSVITKTPSGSGPGNSASNVSNAFYNPTSGNTYFFGTSLGATVYKLTRTGSDPRTATYAWSTLTNAGGSGTPVGNDGGATFGKAQGFVNMGDGRSALLISAQHNGPSWIYKLPAGG
jgi:hypothetical protein